MIDMGRSRRNRAVVCFWLVIASLLASRLSRAQLLEPTGEDVPITIDADSVIYEEPTNTVIARGNVRIQYGETVLEAREVRLNRNTNEATATGNVSLADPEGTLFADNLRVDFDDETGVLVDAILHARRLQYSLWGKRIEKGVGQRYHIEHGRFTTCHCDEGPPSWSIAAENLDVTVGGYGVAQGASFRILGVPVLWVPKIWFPVRRERQSGLLFPRLGVSNRRGFQIVQPFFWAISKSQDATIGFDLETSARVGLLGEYRYTLSPTLYGKINAGYFNEAIRGRATESARGPIDDPSVPENRWGVFSEHTQWLGSVEMYADLQLVGDDLFLREINALTFSHREDVALRTRPFTESRVGGLQRWNRLVLQGEAVVHQDLVDRDSLVLQRVPEFRISGQKRLGLGLMAQLAGSATNFQRERGIDGFRGDLQPGLQLRLPLGRSVFGSLRATYHETVYQLTNDEMTGGFRGDDPAGETIRLPSSETREIFELGVELSSGASRVFEFPYFGVQRLKHTIEPRLEYLYIPQVSQEDVMVFDGLDRLDERNLFTYGFVTRLLARDRPAEDGPGEVYELTRLSISQSYDVGRRIPSATGGEADHFSDIDLGLRINPSRRTRVLARSSYDYESGNISVASVGLHLTDLFDSPAGEGPARRLLNRTRLGLTYRFVANDPLRSSLESLMQAEEGGLESEGIQQVDSSIELGLTERLGLLYASRYNIRDDQFLENHFGIRLVSACDCWSIVAGVTDKSNPNEIELRLQVTLVGLGSGGI